VKPNVDISTPWAFKKLDQKVIKNHPDINGIIQLLKDENYLKLNAAMGNVFEEVAFEEYPEIRDIKNDLMANGAIAAIMTGSGSTLVGYYREKECAETAWQLLRQKYKMCFLSQISEN
jgi:4-diphosphocytidyl-2-C-methyl-D-erythritol kinase